jgi:hypothetical protein
MSLFDSIFGASGQTQAMNSYLGNQAMANNIQSQYTQNQLANAYTQQMINQYQMYRNKPKWVYNGIECTLKEFADLMYNDDEQGKLMFILKHGGI